MSVIRVNKTKNYTVMSNTHLRERDMSLKAKGLLSIMLSLPDDWDYSISGLCKICVEKESAIKSTLKELKEFGYLIVTKLMPDKSETGRIEYIYNIYESPIGEKQATEKQATEKQGVENLSVEFQSVENPLQLNTNKPNTKELNTKEEILNADYDTEFLELWKLYPNKQGKDKALKAYIKARKEKNGTTFEQVKNGLMNYVKYIELNKFEKKYIKHGSTWFNGREWENEYDLPNEAPQQEYVKGVDYF